MGPGESVTGYIPSLFAVVWVFCVPKTMSGLAGVLSDSILSDGPSPPNAWSCNGCCEYEYVELVNTP